MKIALFQIPQIWESPSDNRDYIDLKLDGLSDDVSLVILPEMFTSGFTMNPSAVAENMEGKTLTWMQTRAAQYQFAIVGSIVVKEEDSFYNRLLFVRPDGSYEYYDKRHLFTLAGEEKVYTPGTRRLEVDYLGWKFCLLICYDLRFPVFSRNTTAYDALIYVASWPTVRTQYWDVLLPARAVENVSYAIGVNRSGTDANGMDYIGHSQVLNPLGEYVQSPIEGEHVIEVTLDKSMVNTVRSRFAFLNDQDAFELIP